MDDIWQLTRQLEGSSVSLQWKDLLDLYIDIDQKESVFTSSLSISCPPSCGTCCEHFIPDITSSEASLIAAYLLFIKKSEDLISRVDPSYEGESCPLYNKDEAYHCQIYPVRSMVCRLFGASPSKTKYNTPIFRKCKYNSDESQPKIIDSEQIIEKVKDIQTMQEASSSFSSIVLDTSTYPLPIAVRNEMDKLSFIASYLATLAEEDPLDRPDPSSPVAV